MRKFHQALDFLILVVILFAFILNRMTFPVILPAEAVEEGRIICSNFDGMRSVKVERWLTKSEEGYDRYTVTAQCRTNHIITSDISIQR